jgi:hypothetical protein
VLARRVKVACCVAGLVGGTSIALVTTNLAFANHTNLCAFASSYYFGGQEHGLPLLDVHSSEWYSTRNYTGIRRDINDAITFQINGSANTFSGFHNPTDALRKTTIKNSTSLKAYYLISSYAASTPCGGV